MYNRILVALDATEGDNALLEHVIELARAFGSTLVLLHVADGWAARWFGPDAVSIEVLRDREYLAAVEERVAALGIAVEASLAYGDPAAEIARWAEERCCELLAMTTHGHGFLTNAILGVTVDRVRRIVRVPVPLVRAD